MNITTLTKENPKLETVLNYQPIFGSMTSMRESIKLMNVPNIQLQM